MEETGIRIKDLPKLKEPLLIAGFGGWGNALGVSNSMVSFLIHKLKARKIAELNSDFFYRYDESRPHVHADKGLLMDITPPGGSFHYARTDPDGKDIVVLKAKEPNLRWIQFADDLFSFCFKLGIRTVISVGGMYDNVLHTDRIISGFASDKALLSMLLEKDIMPISYQGPGGIHSTLSAEGQKRGFQCISLWCHCPYYLQGTTHFGLLSHLGSLLATLGGFKLDTTDLEMSWKELSKEIQKLIDEISDLQAMIDEVRKAKVRGSWESMKGGMKRDDKIIHIKDFLKPR